MPHAPRAPLTRRPLLPSDVGPCGANMCSVADARIVARRVRAISLFTGAGGLDLGCEARRLPHRRGGGEQRRRARDAARERRRLVSRTRARRRSSRTSWTSTRRSCSTAPAPSAGEIDLRPRRAPVHAVLEVRLLARVQASRCRSERHAARQLRRDRRGDATEGLPHGERLRARLPQPEPAGPRPLLASVRRAPATRSTRRSCSPPTTACRSSGSGSFCVGIRKDLLDMPRRGVGVSLGPPRRIPGRTRRAAAGTRASRRT